MNQQESGLSFERVVFFSDAVFAIVITLLVLEIKPPHIEELSNGALNTALFSLLPKFIGFVISFLITGLMWIEHHRIFRYIKDYDVGLLWRNLLLLLCVSFVPFPTALFSEYYWSLTAFILYTASFAAVGVAKLWVWQYAVGKPNLIDADVDDVTVKRISRRSLAVPLSCVVAILLSLISIRLAPFGFALIPVLAALLDPTRGKAEKKEIHEIASDETAT
ncbi:MAG TPA: TMEM175 family protein [Pyrinomonadaceae bacterium]|nr:TMEM175 family protein [Pyrinomonadaceae bacterium]